MVLCYREKQISPGGSQPGKTVSYEKPRVAKIFQG